ncbi:MAG TPA: site-specific integrase [Rhizomicrobium sp.]|jgi:integrase
MRAHITDELAKRLKENEVFWDDLDTGFGVRRQRRSAVFIVRYRQNRVRQCITIGRHEDISAEEARRKAQTILEAVRKRAPEPVPWNMRRSKNGMQYFGEVAERYLAEFAKPRKKPKSLRADRRNLELHILPRIGNLKLSQIDRPLLIKLHASQQETPIAANRCLALISHIFSMAEKWGITAVGSNPCRGIDRFPETFRERYLNEEDLIRLGDALKIASDGYQVVDWSSYSRDDRFTRRSPEDWRAVAAARLLLLTGARMNEILTMRWSWIDWRLGIARLPDSKTGPKTLFLPEPALRLLEELKVRVQRDYSRSPFILPGDRVTTNFQGLFGAWQRIRTIARLKDLRLHDLRHVYASTAVASGDSLYIVGRILGHRRSETTQRYAHLAIDPIRQVANRTAAKLADLLNLDR